MGLLKIALSFFLVGMFFNAATHFPNIQFILSKVHDTLHSWMPLVMDLIGEIAVRVHKYCTERLLEDIKKGITTFTKLLSSLFSFKIQTAVRNVLQAITDGLIAFHNNGMGYTDEILHQLLGIDGKDYNGNFLNIFFQKLVLVNG